MMRPNELKYHYNPDFDTLNIYLDKGKFVYSDEEYAGIYILRDEKDDHLVGIEILDFSQRNRDGLREKLGGYGIDFSRIQILPD